MDKVTKQKNPKRQAAGRKSHEKYMAKLKEDILKNVGNDSSSNSTNGGSSGTNSSSSSCSSGTNSSSGSSSSGTNGSSSSSSSGTNSGSGSSSSSSTNFSYIHGVGVIAVLALGACIFIIPKYLKKTAAQPQNKSPEKISKIRRKML